MCKSTIDWCERNYVVSEDIAEFWNTLSGLAIGASALYWRFTSDIWRCSTDIKRYFYNIFWYLIFVSIGTMLFHGTLLYKYQLMDELPMLLIAMQYTKIMSTLKTSSELFSVPMVRMWFYATYIGKVIVFVIPITYYVHPMLHNVVFHTTLKVFEGIVLFMLYKLSKGLNAIVYDCVYNNNYLHLTRCGEPKEKILPKVQDDIKDYILTYRKLKLYTKMGVRMYGVSLTLWVLENLFCEHVEFLQFHAWWHVLSSVGIYYLNKIVESHVKIHLLVTKKVKIE